MENQNPQPPPSTPPNIPPSPASSPASAPVTPTGAPYQPPITPLPPTSSQILPPIPPAKKGIPLLLLVIILLLIVGSGAGIYFWSMQSSKPQVKNLPMPPMKPSPTLMPTDTPMASPAANASISADWKTYINEKENYSLTYPTDKLVRMQCPDEELDLEEKLPSNENLEGTPLPTCGRDTRFLIEIKTYSASYTLPDVSSNYAVKTNEFTLNGTPATKYTYTQTKPFEGQGGPAWFQEVLIKTNNKTYEFYLGNEKFQSLFDQILSTFKFTK